MSAVAFKFFCMAFRKKKKQIQKDMYLWWPFASKQRSKNGLDIKAEGKKNAAALFRAAAP